MMKRMLSAIFAIVMCASMTQIQAHAKIEYMSPATHVAFVYGREPVRVDIDFSGIKKENASAYREQIEQYVEEMNLDAVPCEHIGSAVVCIEAYVTREQLRKMRAHDWEVGLIYLDENGEHLPEDWVIACYHDGDVNGDNVANASDAAMILMDCAQFGASGVHLLDGGSYFVVPGERLASADYNYDGEVTAADAAAVLIHAAKVGANGYDYHGYDYQN